jgi:flagellar hook-length control protein FliK
MKNLSLQMSHTAPLKQATDTANKNNVIVDKSAAVEPSNSFQMMLNRQVRNQKDLVQNSLALQEAAQKTSSLQNNTDLKVVDEKAESNTSYVELVAKTDIEGQSSGKKVIAKSSHDTSESKKAGFLDGFSVKPIEQTVPIAKALLVAAEDDTDSNSEEVVNNATDASRVVSVTPFVQVILTPVVNTIGLGKAQETSSESAEKNSLQSATTVDAGSQKQRNLDAVLNNAMAQSNSTQSKEGQASRVKAPENGFQIDTNTASEQTRWQATVQQNAVKQAVEGELINVKLVSNTAKDSINKDVIMPASYQSAAQNNAIMLTQQTASSSNIIQAYPGKTGWDQAISQKVVWMVGASEQSATLTLNPPDLGPLQVVINVNNDMVNAAFMSDNAEVRQALQDGMATLREKLGESGIQLGQASVSSGGQQKQEFQQAMQNRLVSQHHSHAPVLAEEKIIISNSKVQLVNGLVDTFV